MVFLWSESRNGVCVPLQTCASGVCGACGVCVRSHAAGGSGTATGTPSLQGPSLQGPSLQGPSLQGPSLQGPSLQGPSLQGPTVGASRPRHRAATQGSVQVPPPTPTGNAECSDECLILSNMPPQGIMGNKSMIRSTFCTRSPWRQWIDTSLLSPR